MREMPKFDPRLLSLGFVVGEIALRQVFLQILRSPLLISFYQVSVVTVYSPTTYHLPPTPHSLAHDIAGNQTTFHIYDWPLAVNFASGQPVLSRCSLRLCCYRSNHSPETTVIDRLKDYFAFDIITMQSMLHIVLQEHKISW